MQPLNVHFLYEPEAPYLDYLREQLAGNIHLTFGLEPPSPAQYHILIAGRPTAAHLIASPNLHSMLIPFAGVPDTTQTLMRDFPQIDIYNLHHNAASTAEMAIALLLAATKYLIPADRIFREHDWTPRHAPMPSQILTGKTALIVGYGAIGRRVANVCRALGMQVMGIKRTPAEGTYHDPVYAPPQLPDLLPQSTALIICLPITPDTRGMIGAKEIALLPADAVIINVGRAAIVDEEALYEALRDGRIHAAGFDVWYNYPTDEASRTQTPPGNYPFHELDNIVMSPHRAGGVGTDETEYARMDALAQSLNVAARGEPMPNKVNLTAGY